MELKSGYEKMEAGVIPEDWSFSALGNLGDTSSGTTPARILSERYFGGGTINWVKTLDLNNSLIHTTDECVTEFALNETSLRIYPKDTILVAMYGGFNQIGRTGILGIPACVNQAITAFRCGEQLDPSYLLAIFNFKVKHWKSVASSSRKDPNITSKDIRDFVISYPKKAEQKAIAEALSDADALIESLNQLIAKKLQIKKGAMQDFITGRRRLPGFHGKWEVKRLGEIANIKTGNRNNQDKIEDGAYPFFVRSSTVERINIFSHDCEAILIPGEGGIGNIFHYIVGKFNVHQRVYAITNFSTEIFGKFIYFYMATRFGAHAMENSVKATVDSLRLPTFQDFKIEMPSTLAEQTAIATLLNDMDAELAALKSRLNKARQIKQGMMQQLLTGQIRLV